jgi:hypothetical protein
MSAKYQNGKIYLIKSLICDDIYIGSTAIKSLATVKSLLKSNYRKYLNGNANWHPSFGVFEADINAYIQLYELFPCSSRDELMAREQHVLEEFLERNNQIEN